MAVRAVYVKLDFTPAGIPEGIRRGTLYRSDDPLVKRYPTMFTDVLDELGIVEPKPRKKRAEKATANPGETRDA
jgi:hypothetical protein